jgi:protease-4
MGKLGIEDQTFTAGEYKDAGSPLRAMRPEERSQIQAILDDLHARFREVVAEGRPGLGSGRVAALADGRIYSAEQALREGLIDGIADLPGAIEEAKRRAGVAEARVVSLHRERDWRENLYTQAPPAQAGRPVPALVAAGLGTRWSCARSATAPTANGVPTPSRPSGRPGSGRPR